MKLLLVILVFFATTLISLANSYPRNFTESFGGAAAVTLQISPSESSVSSAGVTITYTYTVTNEGDEELTGISVIDDQLGAVTLDETQLAPAGTTSGTATYQITQADMDSGADIVNQATVTTTEGATFTDDVTVSINQLPSVTIDVTPDKTSVSSSGETITYTYTVTNTGNVTLTGISVTDDQLGAVTLDETQLAPTGTTSGTATYQVTQADMDSGADIVNQATVTTTEGATFTDDVTVSINQLPSVTIDVTPDKTSVSSAGETITYTYTVTNTGNVTLTGISVIDDQLGAVALDETQLAPAGTTSGTATYQVTQADMDSGADIENQVTVTTTEGATFTDDVTVSINQLPSVTIDVTPDKTSVSSSGETITYTYTVTNTGNVTLTGISVTDDQLGAVALDETQLAPAGTTSGTATYQVTQADINSGADIENQATVTTTEGATFTDDVTVSINQLPSVTIDVTPDKTSVSSAGETITYTIEVENVGNVGLTNVVVTDVFAGGAILISGDTNSNSVLDVGETWIYSADYEVTQGDIDAGTDLVNVASVDTDQTDPAEDSATTGISQGPALSITKDTDKTSVSSAGETITYTIEVENVGNVGLTNVVVTDVFAGGATLISGDTNSNSVLDVGETWIYNADYEVTQGDIDAGTDLVNVASVDTDQTDPAEDSATTSISQGPALSITKDSDKTSVSSAGETITYTIEVENVGNVGLTNVVVTDVFAGGATLISGDTNSNSVLDVGETWIYNADYEVTQGDIDAGTDLVNVASVDTDQTDPAENSATTSISQGPALTITKDTDKTSVSSAGETISYTIEVENVGNVGLTNVVVTDVFAGGATLISGDTNSNSVLDVGETWIYSADYEVTQGDIDAGTDLVNVASVDTDQTDPAGDSATTVVNQQPELSLSKTASVATYSSVGEAINYTIEVENAGNVTLTGVSVTDPLTGLNTTISSLAPGAKQPYNTAYNITQGDINSGSVVNTASVSGTAPDNSTINASATETITASQQAGLVVSKSAAPSTYSSVGELITYTIIVKNTGNLTISGITVTDPLTGLNSSISSLAPDVTQTQTTTYHITQADLNSGSVTNIASASGKDPYNETVTASDNEVVTAIQLPELTVTESATPATFSSIGQQITYTVEVENTGNVTISGIAVTDALTGLNTTIASLVPGATQSFTETYNVTAADLNSGSLANTANASGTAPDNATVTASDTETITAIQQPGLAITKDATPSVYDQSGQEITYSIQVTNTGNVTLSDVSVTDPLTGLNTTIPAFAAGATETYTEKYTVTQPDLNTGSVTNTASASGSAPDNSTVNASDSETVTADQQPGLTITKNAVPSTFSVVGQEITYTIEVENTGNVTLSGISVTDPLTGLNTTIVSLVPGAKQTYTENYTITQNDLNLGSVANTANASGTSPASETITGTATETISASQEPGLTVVKNATPSSYTSSGEEIIYTIEVTNSGNVTLSNVLVSDPLTGLNTTIASLAPGAKQTYTENYFITQNDLNSGSVANTASASGKSPDDETITGSATRTISASQEPGLTVSKSASPQTYSTVGQQIDYTIEVENSGNVSISNISVVDALTGLSTTIASLAPGAKQTYTENYSITQNDLNTGSVANTATASGKSPDNETISDSATETISGSQNPALTVSKAAAPTTYNAVGQQITYTIGVENTGNVTVSNISVTDPLTGLSTTIASLSPGAKQTYSENYNITQADLNLGSVSNTASAAGFSPQSGDVSASDELTILAVQQPALQVTKDASLESYSSPGESVVYDIPVKNIGNVTVTDILLTDPLVELSTQISTLAPGESKTFTEAYSVSQLDLDNGNLTNTATASGLSPGAEAVDADGEKTIPAVQNPALAVVKKATPATFANINSEISYTIEVENAGNVTLSEIAINDALISLTESMGTLVPGQKATYTKSYFVKSADYAAGSVTNTVTVSAKAPDGSSQNASDTKIVYALGPPTAVNDLSSDNITGNNVVINILGNDKLHDNSSANPGLVDVDLNNTVSGRQTERTVAGEGVWSYNVATGEVTFNPDAGFTADPTPIIYILTEKLTGRSNNATITVQFNKGEPFAINDNSAGNKPGDAVSINILANDRLSDGTPVSIPLVSVDINASVAGTQNELVVAGEGRWTYNPQTGFVTFTPNPGFTTDPSPLTYLLKENFTGLSDDGIVTIGYDEEPPLATDDSSSGNEPGDVVSVNILANDKLSDGTSASMSFVSVDIDAETDGIQSNVVIEGEGTWNFNAGTGVLSFAPAEGFTVSPSPLEYILIENLTGLSSTGTVTVLYEETAPVAADDSSLGNKPGATASIAILSNDKLSDGTNALRGLVTVDLDVTTDGIQTELVVSGEGTWQYNPQTGLVTFVPVAGFVSNPTPIVYLLIENLSGLSDTATIVAGYSEEPPVAEDDSSEENTPGSAVALNILTNDKLSDGSPALPESVTVDIDIASAGVQAELVVQGEGTWSLNQATGVLTFMPNNNFYANPTPLTYRLCSKASPGLCDEATVSVSYDESVLTTSVALVKTDEYNSAGGTIKYTFEVTNTGEITVSDLAVSDERIGVAELPVTPATLTPGAKGIASVVYKILQSDIDEGGVTNTAKVRGLNAKGESVEDISGNDMENDEPTVTPIVQQPSVYIEKEAVLYAEKVAFNEEVSFNISVTNTGNVTLYNVLVEDPLTGFEQETPTLEPGGLLNFTTSYVVQAADESEGHFDNEATVVAYTSGGSQVDASFSVTVSVEQCDLVIPTGFSPNDDGIQDTWRIKCLERYPNARIEIFNRWGNRVFEKDNFGNTDIHGSTDAWWDGYSTQKLTFGNEKMPTGTYFYILDLKDGSKPLNGYLFLNR
ncbi:conserved repeat domain-containing protein/gliding motility-associated C-terminal domain-containing protein [Mariniphaga anaerophila]|uniref:Conserved repeat domain-containing protein/gliding motility-associated C-terminal domain-containing protein n=1 Tax=Mariniphaga anaerophila TaxID=1484053 RepID=A0A1M5FFN8_9BACT|nr:gliding motility-associated C-terminal domain-containing protein [Mariniphaga anaerophila]SHF89982.1 conserved repeat domain-containing protein/gliding motility-associated C-terminal domain-containing protein [Mariniphaga anaerophila]